MLSHLVVVMDAIAHINPAKDTTFAMMLEAQRRNYPISYVIPGSLSVRDGSACARIARIHLNDTAQDFFRLEPTQSHTFCAGDTVLMRTDPPVDANYLHDTQILHIAQQQGARIVNNPQGLRDLNEKLAAQLFPQFCPPTLVSRDAQLLKAFVHQHQEAVLKPLDGMGGRSIFRASQGDANLNVILETLTDSGRTLAMAQRYLPEIRDGDKRILLIDGEPVPYALARIPQGDEFRGNLAAGGRGEGRPLTARDREIATFVGARMQQMGMRFVGLDVIGDWLTEVNVTSPTGVRELDKQFGINIAGMLFDALQRDTTP